MTKRTVQTALALAVAGAAACAPARPPAEQPPRAGTRGEIGGILLVSSPEQGRGSKVLVASYTFTPDGVRVGEAIVAFGSANRPQSAGEEYAFELAAADGRVLEAFSRMDPRRVVVEQEGLVQVDSAVFAARFPFDPQAQSIRVLDAERREVARTDIGAVIREFCAQRRDDPDCRRVPQPRG